MLKCPNCEKEFEKLTRGGICPNFDCRTPLKLIEREEDGVIKKVAVFRKWKETFVADDIEVYETIYNRDNVSVEKSNRGNYIVSFIKMITYNWIHCPQCESKMFQNNMLRGSFEHKCHKCKTVTTYIFK